MKTTARLVRFAPALCLLLAALLLPSCGSDEAARKELGRQVDGLNKDLPAYMRAGYVLDSIRYIEAKNKIVYSYSVDTTYMPRGVFHERLAQGKDKIINSMITTDPDVAKFVKTLIRADATLVYSYTFSDGVTERIPVSAQEINEKIESIK